MKRFLTFIGFSLVIILGLNACSQEKKDMRSFKGKWQRIIVDFSSQQIDTVSFDRKHFYSNEGTFKYHLDDHYLILEESNGEEWTRWEYTFETKEQVHLEPMFSQNENITLFKID